MTERIATALVMAVSLTACAPGAEGPEVRRTDPGIAIVAPSSPAPIALHEGLAPPGADPSLCWARDRGPTRVVTETVREREGGVLVSRTRQRIEADRDEFWFESPCPPALTQDFVASLQRALKARGLYRGPIDGTMSPSTQQAVRAYQVPLGLASGTLSMAAARALGLAPVLRPSGG